MSSPQEAKLLKQLAEALNDEPHVTRKAERLARWTYVASWLLLFGLFLGAFNAREEGLWRAVFAILGCAAGILFAVGFYSQQSIIHWRVLRPFLDAEAIRRADAEQNP